MATTTRIQYDLSEFNATKASQGALCAVVSSDVSIGTIDNISNKGVTNSDFIGAGICKKESSECYSIMVNSVYYQFYASGAGRYPNSSYKLMMAKPVVSLTAEGNSSTSSSTVVYSRAKDGSISTNVTYDKTSDLLIDTLNARDEFAINALKELLSRVNDPAVLSDSEMNYYCTRAYQWAANMMSVSADTRGTFKEADTTVAGATTRANIATSSLSTPTEKLLNNIMNALERDDYVETITTTDATTGKTTTTTNYYDRVKVQFTELMTFLNTYIKKDEKTVYSFKDLITPITTLSTVLSTYIKKDNTTTVGLNDLITAVNAVKTSADSINTSNTKLLTKIIDVSNTQTAAINDLQDATDAQSDSIDSLESTVSSQGYRLNQLSSAINSCMTQSEVDARVKAWLNATTIVSDGSGGYKLSVPGSI